MANKRQKHPALLQGHRPRPQLITIPRDANAGPAPPPPRGLLAVTKRRWARFWASPVASLIDRHADMGRIERWIIYWDEWERSMRRYRKFPVVFGASGQPVLNPLAGQILRLERELSRMEEKFGMTPQDRLRLGVQLGEAHRSLADLTAAIAEDDNNDDGEEFIVPDGYEVVNG